MKRQLLQKCLTGVLCLALIFTTVPTAKFQVFAEETEVGESKEDMGKSTEDMSGQDGQDNELANNGAVEEESEQDSIDDESEKDDINEGEESESEEKDTKKENFEESKSENEEDGLDDNSENDLEDEQSKGDGNEEIGIDEDIIDDGMLSEENETKLMNISEEIASGSYKDISWVIDANGKLTVTGTGDYRYSTTPWSDYKESIISAEVDVAGMTRTSYMFNGCSNLKEVDLSSFDTSNVTNMKKMFYDCKSLESLDLSNFNTHNVTDMSHMFYECTSLINLDLGSFDTSNVTDMSHMFDCCRSLKSLNISSFNTSNVTSMNSMFCLVGLENLDLSHFNTGNVTDMNLMFFRSHYLKHIDVSSFNTIKVTRMLGMFRECESLQGLDLSSFSTSNVTDMATMFYKCESLQDLDLSNFNTSNVTDMSEMFSDCKSLTNLNLSGFNIKNVTNMANVFSGCKDLTTMNTPYNVNVSAPLPYEFNDKWYRSDGTEVTELPQGLNHSIVLGKNYIPEEKEEGGEIGEGVSDEVEIMSGVRASKDASAVVVIDRKTGKPVSGAHISVNGDHWTNDQGVVELSNAGLTTIQVDKEGYIAKTTKKKLEKGKVHTIFLVPDTGIVEIVYAALRLTGEDENIMDDVVYLKAGDLEDWEGVEETFVLTMESSGKPTKYQLIQDGKILNENTTGIFDLTGRYITDSRGNVSCCIDCLSAGHRVYGRVYDDQNNYKTKELGIRISEKSSTIIQIKEQNGKGNVNINDASLVVTIPDSIPLLGGSELNFGLTEKLPINIDIDNSGKVRVALNMGDFDTSDSAAWYDKKEEYDHLSERAESLWNAAETFGGTPVPFGAGMYAVKANIMGYGEGYLDDSNDKLCINVGVIMSVKGEAEFTQYYFLAVVPVYITFGGGVSGTASGEIMLSFDGDGMSLNGGNLETEISPYLNLEGGVGADGILSVGVYGNATLNWLHRYTNNYNRVSLNGNAKVKATAFLWSKVLAELDGTWVIYDSNNRAASYANLTSSAGLDGLDMSDAQVISMDYLLNRAEMADVSVYSLTSANFSETNRFMSYAYENASPRLVRVGSRLYMFYLDGVEERDAQNQTALFYQSSPDNGATWTDAVRVDGNVNETADYDFDVAVYGEKIYVIWSDAGKVYGNEILSMDSEKAIATVGKEMDLMLAVINSNTGAITTTSIATEAADMKPHIVSDNGGTVYVSWVTDDAASADGLFSGENQMGVCYASSADNYAVHSIPLTNGYYPLTLDAGIVGTEICTAIDVDTDGNLNTQEDREIYTLNLTGGDNLTPLTSNDIVDSVPVFGKTGGNCCLFWYKDGNIAYTSDKQNIKTVFEDSDIPSMGQDFSIMEGNNGNASIVWTITSVTEDAGVDLYCTDFDGTSWSNAYKLDELESEYTSSVSGFRDGSDYKITYLGSTYEGDELYSHIYLYTPEKRTDTSVTLFAEQNGVQGENYPLHLTVTNDGNVAVDSLEISSADGSIQETVTGLSIAPGTIYDFTWGGIVLPLEMSEIYTCNLTIKASGETDIDKNVFDLTIGEPDFSIESYLDYSDGDRFAGIAISNNGILSSEVVLAIYKDEEHTNQLYQTSLTGIMGGETRISIFDLTTLDSKSPVFYFTIMDKNGLEIYTGNNEAVLYSGKGTYLEDDLPESDDNPGGSTTGDGGTGGDDTGNNTSGGNHSGDSIGNNNSNNNTGSNTTNSSNTENSTANDTNTENKQTHDGSESAAINDNSEGAVDEEADLNRGATSKTGTTDESKSATETALGETQKSTEKIVEAQIQEDGLLVVSEDGNSGGVIAIGTIPEAQARSIIFTVREGSVSVTITNDGCAKAAGVADAMKVVNAILTKDQIKAVESGEKIKIRIDVEDLATQISQEDKEVIEKGLLAIGTNEDGNVLTIGGYFDISVNICIGENGWSMVEVTNEPLEVVIGVVDELRSEDRKFYVARSHGGEFTLLDDIDKEIDTVTIETNLFSAYALVYGQATVSDDAVSAKGEDGATAAMSSETGGTGWALWLAGMFMLVVCCGMVIFVMHRRHRQKLE